MQFEEYFPLWDKLTPQQRDTVRRTLIRSTVKKGEVIHNGSLSCAGLLVLKTGQFRAYMLSEEGREITLYRLFERDICLFFHIQSILFQIQPIGKFPLKICCIRSTVISHQ